MIRYADEALDDLERLRDWLRERDPRAAARFFDRVEAAETAIAHAPRRYPHSADGQARRYLFRFGRSVYVIHYVEEDADQVIVRLWHGREARP